MKARILLFEDGNWAVTPIRRIIPTEEANVSVETEIQIGKKDPIAVYEGDVPDDIHEKDRSKKQIKEMTKAMKKLPTDKPSNSKTF
jgi:hypothetical protein